jgi:hypothetical protein
LKVLQKTSSIALRYSPPDHENGLTTPALAVFVDEYTAEAMLFHQKFRVAPNKAVGWKRLVGQEVPVDGYTGLQSIAGRSVFPASLTGIDPLVSAGADALGAPANAAQTARRLVQVVNGPQTPKFTQPALDLWVPLAIYVTDKNQGAKSTRTFLIIAKTQSAC